MKCFHAEEEKMIEENNILYREYDDDMRIVALDIRNTDGTISRMKIASLEKDLFDCEIARLGDPDEDDLK